MQLVLLPPGLSAATFWKICKKCTHKVGSGSMCTVEETKQQNRIWRKVHCHCMPGYQYPECEEFLTCKSKSKWNKRPCRLLDAKDVEKSPVRIGCDKYFWTGKSYCWRQRSYGSSQWCWGVFDGKYKKCLSDFLCSEEHNDWKPMHCDDIV